MIKKVTIEEIEQMALNGEDFKIKVTPETSKLIQQRLMNRGFKRAKTGNTPKWLDVPLLSFVDGNIDSVDSFDYAPWLNVQEIQLIEEPIFKTQQDIWRYLADGGKVIGKLSNTIWYFIDGQLYSEDGQGKLTIVEKPNFIHISNYSPYIPPKQWYEEIPEQGVLCWVWYKDTTVPKDIISIVKKQKDQYVSYQGLKWPFATPLTEEEVNQYIYKGKGN